VLIITESIQMLPKSTEGYQKRA